MELRYESVDCGLKAGVSGLWTGGGNQKLWTGSGSQWIVGWRRESVDCGLEAGVSGL